MQSLQEKIQDLGEVVCAEGSEPDSIVGRKVLRLDYTDMVPAQLSPPPRVWAANYSRDVISLRKQYLS